MYSFLTTSYPFSSETHSLSLRLSAKRHRFNSTWGSLAVSTILIKVWRNLGARNGIYKVALKATGVLTWTMRSHWEARGTSVFEPQILKLRNFSWNLVIPSKFSVCGVRKYLFPFRKHLGTLLHLLSWGGGRNRKKHLFPVSYF